MSETAREALAIFLAQAPPAPRDRFGAHDFVVGYCMDYAERHRNLRGVYRLTLDSAAG